ncbi:MAG: HipA N-terminal domain-containing protein [Acidimicrobiales bacterium]
MTYQQVDLIEVYYHGAFVGAVATNPETGRYVFEYDREWIARGAVRTCDVAQSLLSRLQGITALAR